MKKIKGFKGFDQDLKCRGFQYEIGKAYKTDKQIDLCSWGFHFCQKLLDVNNYYSFDEENNRFCEVEVLGQVINGNDKSVTNKIKIIRELTQKELNELINYGGENKGYCNTGDGNTGNCNTGNRNTGYCNTGDGNTGNWNTGDCNTGNRNTGYRNTGDCNTGNRNTGYRNTGDCNTGDGNTGNRNTGDWNTGDWNKTTRSNGVFCIKEPQLIMFNKKCNISFKQWRNSKACKLLNCIQKKEWISYDNMNEFEKEKFPNAKTCGGYLKAIKRKNASQIWWINLKDQEKKEIFQMPNFDLNIFNEIMELEITKEEYDKVMRGI